MNIYTYFLLNTINDQQLNINTKLQYIKHCIDLGAELTPEIIISTIKLNNYDIIKMFVDTGREIIITGNYEFTRTNNDFKFDLRIIKLLVEISDINTLLTVVCMYPNSTDCVEYLLSVGADATSNDNRPIKLLVDAYYTYNKIPEIKLSLFESTKLLLLNNADANSKPFHSYLLEIYVFHNDLNMCKLLLDFGADINLCNIQCTYYTYTDIANLFMEHGSDKLINIKN